MINVSGLTSNRTDYITVNLEFTLFFDSGETHLRLFALDTTKTSRFGPKQCVCVYWFFDLVCEH